MFAASASIDIFALPRFAFLCEDGSSIKEIVVITWNCRHLTVLVGSVFCKQFMPLLGIWMRAAAAALLCGSVGYGTIVHAHVLYMVMLLKLTQDR